MLRHVRAGCFLLLACWGLQAAAAAQAIGGSEVVQFVPAAYPNATLVNRAFTAIMHADKGLSGSILELEKATLETDAPWGSKQLTATAFALVGKYQSARRIRNDHRGSPPACLKGGEVWPAAAHSIPNSVKVLIINEEHIDPSTRAQIFVALPTLRAMGFKVLAMEAIPDQGVKRAISSGWIPENAAVGVYLREPINALMIRRAVDLGFSLMAYDQTNFDSNREEAQADYLKRAAASSHDRIVVITGPGHVRSSGGWMAERLSSALGKRLYTIDQVSYLGAACPTDQPARLAAAKSLPSAEFNDMGTDAVLVTSPIQGGARSYKNSWLTLGGVRHAVSIDSKEICRDFKVTCLIEATRLDAPQGSVPQDRYLASPGWKGFIFLMPGEYVVSGTDDKSNRRTIELVVK